MGIDFGLVQNNYNPYVNGGLGKTQGYNPGLNGYNGGIGSAEGTELQRFKKELGLGKSQGIESVKQNQYVTNSNLYNNVSKINGELSPESRNELQGNKLYAIA